MRSGVSHSGTFGTSGNAVSAAARKSSSSLIAITSEPRSRTLATAARMLASVRPDGAITIAGRPDFTAAIGPWSRSAEENASNCAPDSSRGAASLQVTAGALDHLVLSPASATIGAGGSQVYTAEGRDRYNNSLGDVTSSTTFSISPDGSCTGATCTASATGAHTVTGTSAGKTGTASLTVSANSLDHIVISPASATISAGGSQAYTAQGFDASNNSLGDVTAFTTFSISPEGSCTGSVCTANAGGPHTVTGNDGGKHGRRASRTPRAEDAGARPAPTRSGREPKTHSVAPAGNTEEAKTA